MSKNRLNKCIFCYAIEICVLIVFMVVSFVIFTNSGLSSYAQIAANGSEPMKDLEILYARNVQNGYVVLSNANLLDTGVLTIKNTNNYVVSAKATLKMEMSSIDNLDLITLEVNDKIVDKSNFYICEDYYCLDIGKSEVESKKTLEFKINIYGDALYVDTNRLNYHFEVTESFYS